MKKKTIWVVIIVVILAIIALYISNKDNSPKNIKIGGLFGQTGFASFAGEASKNGFIMAIEDAGLDPKNFPIEDFQSDTKNTASAASKLINIDKVIAIIGPEWTEFSEVALKPAESNNVVVISPWMNGEYDWVKSPYYFSMTPSSRVEVSTILTFIKNSGYKKIALVYNNNTWSNSVAGIVKEKLNSDFKDLSLTIDVNPKPNISDYRTDILKIKNSNADAVLAIIDGSSNPDAFIKQMKELKINMPIFFPHDDIDVLVANNKLQFGEGVYYAVSKEYNRKEEFNSKYKTRFGKEPTSISAATAYDATTLVLDAIKNGAKNGDDISKYLSTKVKNYKGYSGIITFDSIGLPIANDVVMMQIVNGTSTLISK